MQRIYSPDLNCHLLQDEAKHLMVRRVEEGEEIEMCDGKGSIARCKVVAMRPARVEILEIRKIKRTTRLSLALGLLKAQRLDLLVEKAVEMGVAEIRLFTSAYTQKEDLSKTHQERLHRIAVSAMKQSGQPYLPTIEIVSLEEALKFDGMTLVGSLDAAPAALPKIGVSALWIVGPEGGFSEGEMELLKSAVPVNLSPWTLRAETAAIAGLSLIQHQMLVEQEISSR